MAFLFMAKHFIRVFCFFGQFLSFLFWIWSFDIRPIVIEFNFLGEAPPLWGLISGIFWPIQNNLLVTSTILKTIWKLRLKVFTYTSNFVSEGYPLVIPQVIPQVISWRRTNDAASFCTNIQRHPSFHIEIDAQKRP